MTIILTHSPGANAGDGNGTSRLQDEGLTNTASAASSPPTGPATSDPDESNNSSTVSETVAARSDMLLSKEISSGPIVVGNNVSYAITLKNQGPSDAANVVIEDPVPDGTTYVFSTASNGGSCRLVDATVTCSWHSVPNSASRNVTAVVAVPSNAVAGSEIRNTATARSDSPDPTPAVATVTGPVTTEADLTIDQQLAGTLLPVVSSIGWCRSSIPGLRLPGTWW